MADDSPNNFDRLKTGLGNRPAGLESRPQPDKIKKIIVLTRDSGAVRLDKAQVVIGSVVSADVRLSGDGVAPIHAVLERTGEDQVTIYDLASETGVFVNDAKTVTRVLSNGDTIKIGRHSLGFQLEDFDHSSNKIRYRQTEGRNLFMNPSEDFTPLLLEDEREVDEIFDYRPAQLTALEAVMSWHETILDVQHFVSEAKVIVGNGRGVDFGLPPLLASERYPLLERQSDENYVLNIDDRMKGVVQRKGDLKSLDEIRTTAPRGVAGYAIPIQKGDFAKVSIGEVDFYLSFTAAPPRLRMSKMFERDPFLMKILLSSMLLTSVTVVGLLRAPVQQNVEAEQIPERIATILYQPEKYVQKARKEQSTLDKEAKNPPQQPEKPQPNPQQTTKIDITPNPKNAGKPVPKEMDTGKTAAGNGKASKNKNAAHKGQSEAKQGEGARHKGTEGERGSKKSKDTSAPPQNKAHAASPQGGAGQGGGNSQVPDIGNVDLLKGASAKIENLLGNSAANLGGGGEKLKGFGGFTTQGNDGLAMKGNGAGGGGSSDLANGLGNKGHGGGLVGTGLGAAGNGAGIIGGQTRVAIRTGGSEEAVVMGAIDADAVEAALLAHKDEFRRCYEAEINAENPNLAGRVGTTFVIGNTGRTTQAGIESTTLKNANAERCILNVIKRIDFPIPRGGGVVQVSYPFKFSATGH